MEDQTKKNMEHEIETNIYIYAYIRLYKDYLSHRVNSLKGDDTVTILEVLNGIQGVYTITRSVQSA